MASEGMWIPRYLNTSTLRVTGHWYTWIADRFVVSLINMLWIAHRIAVLFTDGLVSLTDLVVIDGNMAYHLINGSTVHL